MRRRHKFNPNRIRPRRAADRIARQRCAGVLKMLARCIKEDRRKSQ